MCILRGFTYLKDWLIFILYVAKVRFSFSDFASVQISLSLFISMLQRFCLWNAMFLYLFLYTFQYVDQHYRIAVFQYPHPYCNWGFHFHPTRDSQLKGLNNEQGQVLGYTLFLVCLFVRSLEAICFSSGLQSLKWCELWMLFTIQLINIFFQHR